MSEQPKEALSALMDNEVGDFELRSLLKQSADNKELCGQWQRYHLASSLLKNEQLGAGDISAAVMDAVESEPTFSKTTADSPVNTGISGKSFFKPLISMAVAASVTAVVILGGQNFAVNSTSPVDSGLAQAPAPSTATVKPSFAPSRDLMRAQFGAPRISHQSGNSDDNIIRFNAGLNSYIRQHNVLREGKLVSSSPGWIPEGYTPVKNAMAPGAELTVFSNGVNSFTLSIERTGDATVPEGATQLGNMVAVGKKVDDQFFVTVVGDVPLMVADRVVNSIEKIQ
ncbi:MucB/RseB-like protein with C-terminal domain [Amphritea atlantica]|uniref:MucB/RseB-like protein with C-terminal domain n=1 Tax=Amphritea atlantica TaxID=355243 RepID=A0A1H9HL29_9GAMM|nr:MucB/RseB C-terminal domain-containing protein [Amphritea atlantica]SEQ63030.1 MucB/RseB-like protein with C-terminal domain [Amphritea atlantica]